MLSAIVSMLEADFFRLLTEACVDFLRRDLSSAERSIGIIERTGAGRFTLDWRFVGGDDGVGGVDCWL